MLVHMTPTETTAAELTVSEAAAAHDIPKRSLHRAIERGQIPARRVGPLFLVDAEAARLYGEVFKARRALDAYTGRTGSDNDSDSE
ncbi:excise [Mycobacterium phage Jolene]|uniref:Uncharacterized protein n=4 Tax=Liefievirus TaxID=1623288 RepID=Q1A0P5_9CAUD|nr:recombination directionality factor [Mycobacterium phage Liefie]YP_655551.1 recombination directionality factor [Mycobacterium phage Halo]ACU41498.1 hypothetical protein HOPE_34 [Mycobacterium phage Hope]AER48489.1 hypothetical protein AVRAFAN_34 [Mycobacterium phage Avrafan]AGK86149.1 RDF protein [Mycobacterium phage Bo4]AGK86214.1 hypothetical protein DNAIII_0033 [Mycobacterium phage DNAIII]AJK27302.1 RDF protein [Mycobacterium phage Gomashi]AKY02638.1 recombination directionality facto